MAFELDYKDNYGEQYPKSYWRVVQVNISKGDKTGAVFLYGYPDASKKGARIVGNKSYNVGADKFDQYFSTAALEASDPYAIGYQIARDTLDTGNESTKVSFFDGAKEI